MKIVIKETTVVYRKIPFFTPEEREKIQEQLDVAQKAIDKRNKWLKSLKKSKGTETK